MYYLYTKIYYIYILFYYNNKKKKSLSKLLQFINTTIRSQIIVLKYEIKLIILSFNF